MVVRSIREIRVRLSCSSPRIASILLLFGRSSREITAGIYEGSSNRKVTVSLSRVFESAQDAPTH